MLIVEQRQREYKKEYDGVSYHHHWLNPENYIIWAATMEGLLKTQGVWETVDPKNDKLARAIIFKCIPPSDYNEEEKKKTAKEVWESLKMKYLEPLLVKKARWDAHRKAFIEDILRCI